MLTHLSIRNYALISKLEIEFEKGLTIITGETGAGKSILLGALSLIIGQRADSQALKDKNQKCIVEGIFDLKNYSLLGFFKKYNLDYEEKTIIRREINPAGTSRAFINDTPVSLQQVKEIGINLVDIHSQHESLLLNNSEFQFNIVDSFAKQNVLISEFKSGFRELQSLQKELNDLLDKEQKSKMDKDYFQFQFDELESAGLKIFEQEQLEQELEIQNNSEEIKKNIFDCLSELNLGEKSILNKLSEVKKNISGASVHTPILAAIEDRLKSSFIELEDISSELEKIQEDISYSPEKMEIINNRLNIIYSLQQKHRVKTVEELLSAQKDLQNKLNAISSLDNEIDLLKEKIAGEKSGLEKKALKISENRKRVIPKIEKNVNVLLKELGMPNAIFSVMLNPTAINQASGKEELTIHGIDDINILFSANKGSVPMEIHKVASGGELSRLMLSVKSIIARLTSLPTIIFDEIDSGVSGEIADKVGVIMQKMTLDSVGNKKSNGVMDSSPSLGGVGMQVISITHLPQIASKGNSHYFVFKESINGTTETKMKKLSENERVNEIARLLSGEELTKAAIQNARELLKV